MIFFSNFYATLLYVLVFVQDPETKKEMEEMQAKMSVQNQMPEVSELFTNFFGGGGAAPAKKKTPARRR